MGHRYVRQQNKMPKRFCTNALRKNRVIGSVFVIQNKITGARLLNG
jgi:hypothetical protein